MVALFVDELLGNPQTGHIVTVTFLGFGGWVAGRGARVAKHAAPERFRVLTPLTDPVAAGVRAVRRAGPRVDN